MLWDRHSFPESGRRREFLDDAARYGVCSGLAVGLRDPKRVISDFHLSLGATANRRKIPRSFRRASGRILLLANYVHAMLTANIVDRELPPPIVGTPLSPREQECLQLAAKGLGSRLIASCLGVGERTVHFHFGNLLSKLDATNRHHAIAKAVAAGLVEP